MNFLYLLSKAFPRDKQPVDVCALSADEAMKACLKASREFLYRGDFQPISNKKVEKCQNYKVKLHHTQKRHTYEYKKIIK